MTDLTPEQLADREHARRANGEFGSHEHTDPELQLATGNAYADPSTPLNVTVRLEQWDDRDNAFEVGQVDFDARAIFDSRDLADIDPDVTYSDEDWVFEDARAAGIADQHDGPFTVVLPEDFDEYLTHRRENGMSEAYPSAAESLALQVREMKLARRQEALDTASRLLHEAGDGATVIRKVSDFEGGEVLVQGTSRIVVHNVEPSSTMPGLMAVETDFGTLYVAPDQEYETEAD